MINEKNTPLEFLLPFAHWGESGMEVCAEMSECERVRERASERERERENA